MQEISSKVIISQGKTRFAGLSEGTISLSGNRLVIKNETETFLDVPLSEVKKTNFQLTLLYVYTTNNGVKTVNFKTQSKPESEVDVEMDQWVKALGVQNVIAKDSRSLYIKIATVLTVLAFIRIIISVLG
ncbi:MAG: hypothetical protein Q7T41_01165 [Candidatus Saccharibacteria bacterium]|nr:hypothetical protein [Candidatus Saccharibacteria bacterium]